MNRQEDNYPPGPGRPLYHPPNGFSPGSQFPDASMPTYNQQPHGQRGAFQQPHPQPHHDRGSTAMVHSSYNSFNVTTTRYDNVGNDYSVNSVNIPAGDWERQSSQPFQRRGPIGHVGPNRGSVGPAASPTEYFPPIPHGPQTHHQVQRCTPSEHRYQTMGYTPSSHNEMDPRSTHRRVTDGQPPSSQSQVLPRGWSPAEYTDDVQSPIPNERSSVYTDEPYSHSILRAEESPPPPLMSSSDQPRAHQRAPPPLGVLHRFSLPPPPPPPPPSPPHAQNQNRFSLQEAPRTRLANLQYKRDVLSDDYQISHDQPVPTQYVENNRQRRQYSREPLARAQTLETQRPHTDQASQATARSPCPRASTLASQPHVSPSIHPSNGARRAVPLQGISSSNNPGDLTVLQEGISLEASSFRKSNQPHSQTCIRIIGLIRQALDADTIEILIAQAKLFASWRHQLKELLKKQDFDRSGIQLLLQCCGSLLGDRERIMYDRRASPSPVEEEGDRGKAVVRASNNVAQEQHAHCGGKYFSEGEFDVQEDQKVYHQTDRKRRKLMERWNGNTLESILIEVKAVQGSSTDEPIKQVGLAIHALERRIADQDKVQTQFEADLSTMRKSFEQRILWHRNLQDIDVEEIDDPYIDPIEAQLSGLLKDLQGLQVDVDVHERMAMGDEDDDIPAHSSKQQRRLVASSGAMVVLAGR